MPRIRIQSFHAAKFDGRRIKFNSISTAGTERLNSFHPPFYQAPTSGSSHPPSENTVSTRTLCDCCLVQTFETTHLVPNRDILVFAGGFQMMPTHCSTL